MRHLVAAASIAVCGCVSQVPANTHSDLIHAMDSWNASGVENYRYEIEYFHHGCQIIDAKVYVLAGIVTQKQRKIDESQCAEKWTGDPGEIAARSITELFAEIIGFQHGRTLDASWPLSLSFNSNFGYPQQLRLLVNFDLKMYSISPDSDTPLDYEYRLSNFEVLENGT